MGLSSQLDEARGRVLATKPLPTLREAFSAIRHEESRKKVMMGCSSVAPPTEASALVSHRAQPNIPDDPTTQSSGRTVNNSAQSNQMRHGRLWCEKCKKPTHTLETCWKIHGKPPNWKPFRERRANSAATDSPTPSLQQQPFTTEQLDMLQKLFGQALPNTNSSLIGAGSVAHQGLGLGEDDWQC